MSVGEALVHGLLGGTVAASEHYVTDWRDRVKRARDEEDKKRDREHQAGVRKEEQTFQSNENKLAHDRAVALEKQRQTFQATENQLTREQQTNERLGTQEFTTSERDQDVTRKQQAYEATLKLDKKYREPGTQYTWDSSGENLIPVKPGEKAFGPPVAEMDKDGKFQWFGTGTGSGTKGKGLLSRSGSGSAGKAGDSWTTIEIPTGGPLGGSEKRSIYTDTDGKQYQVVPDGQGGTMAIPFNIMQEAPVFVTPEQEIKANQYAEKKVNELAGIFSTDATDFADWKGSREDAMEYFKQNYLQGTHLNQSPTPQQAPAQKPVVQTNDRTDAFIKMYDSLSVNQQDILQQAIKAMQVNKADPALVRQRLLDYGFTDEQLSYLF